MSNVEYVDEAANESESTYTAVWVVKQIVILIMPICIAWGFDGGEPELLTPEDADHTITFAPGWRMFHRQLFDRRSGAGDSAARGPMDRPSASWSGRISAHWNRRAGAKPERFKTKARDGSTDVYGVIFRPSDLDPEAQYPVIDYIYGGPQAIQAPACIHRRRARTRQELSGRRSRWRN